MLTQSKKMSGDRTFAYLSILPALALVLLFMLYPLIYSFRLSFMYSDGINSVFVGWENYASLLQNSDLWRVLLNNIIFLLAVPLILVASLFCAVLIYEEVWGWKVYRVLFFIPSVISTVVIGILFRIFYSYEGPMNQFLASLGIPVIDWFANGSTAIIVIVIALVWSSFGYGMLVLLAGMSNIDPAVFEASRLDGAGWFRRTWSITLPSISKVMQFLCVINVIYTFTSLFGFIYVMTAGGPGYETTTLDYFVYLKAFSGYDMGAGSALAFLLFLVVLLFTYVQFRMFRTE